MASTDKIYPGVVPSPPHPNTYYDTGKEYTPDRRRRNRCCYCCVCLLTSIVAVLVALAVLGTVFWFLVRPRAPKYDIDNVHISSLYSLKSSTVRPVTDFEVMAGNPNKHIEIYYDEISVNIQAYGVSIGDGNLPTFHQGHRNTTIVSGNFVSPGVTFDLAAETALSSGQLVPLRVDVHAKARLKIWSLKTPKMTFKAHCNVNIDLKILTGTQVVSRRCKLKKF